MKGFWSRSSGALLFLLTLFGAVAVAAQLGIVWVVLPLATLALVIGGAPMVWHEIEGVRRAVRQYPKLLGRVADAEAEVEQLKSDLSVAVRRAAEAYIGGIREGWSDLSGRLMANVSEVPRLSAVSARNGLVTLTGDVPKGLRVGTRLGYEMTATGELKGVVTVTAVDGVISCSLTCARAIDEEFWRGLADRPAHEVEAPRGMGLRRLGPTEGTVIAASNGEEVS